MGPGYGGMAGYGREQSVFLGGITHLFQLVGEKEIVPADDGILDQAVASFGDFLLFFVCLGELSGIAHGHSAGKAMG